MMKRANWLVLPATALLVCGCTGSSALNESKEFSQIIKQDRADIYALQQVSALTIEDAITRALEYNLDARIAEQDYLVSLEDAELQKLNSLPTITAKRSFITRNNEAASSSISALTGVQSLEPSISTDQTRWTSMLEANWDVLDSAINIYRSKSALDRAIISEERLRKVRQNIISDVYSAYWRAAIAQLMKPSIEDAMIVSDQKLDALDTATEMGDLPLQEAAGAKTSLLEKRKRLNNLYDNFVLAEIELKALLSFPPEHELDLVVDEDWLDKDQLAKMSGSTDKYIDDALQKRPEIREELLNKRIAERGVDLAIYETIPGLNLLLAYNEDDNSFLLNDKWLDFTASITQSITKILTLPTRYARAEKEEDLADARRKALVAAVISQVYISKTLTRKAYFDYSEQLRLFDVAEGNFKRAETYKDAGLMGSIEFADASLDYEIAKLERYAVYALGQEAQARFMNTLGYDLDDYYHLDVPEISLPPMTSEAGGVHG